MKTQHISTRVGRAASRCLGLALLAALLVPGPGSRAIGAGQALGVDPSGLVWATYLGGVDHEAGEAIALAPDGTVVAVGFTMIFNPSFNIDAFIARFSPDGKTLLNLGMIEGMNVDGAFGVGVDRNGLITVVGQTLSDDFPVTPDAFQDVNRGGGGDGFFLQLNPDFEVVYATYCGGTGEDAFTDLAMDGAGNVVVCGYTTSADFPVTDNAYQGTFGGGSTDAVVVQLSPVPGGSPQITYSSYLGGSADDADFNPDDPYGSSLDERLLRQAVAVTPSGYIILAGMTWSTDFPTSPGAFQTMHSPLSGAYVEDADIYVTVLNPKAWGHKPGGQLYYSTYLGGEKRDVAEDLAVRGMARVTLAALSRSADFPVTANALQPELNGMQDAVVVNLLPLPRIPRQFQVTYSTFLGGSGRDAANGLHRLVTGEIVVGGVATSEDFPTTDGSTLKGSSDLFLTRIKPWGNPNQQLVYSTLFGGSGPDPLFVGPVGSGQGDLFITGDTSSSDLPGVEGSYQETYGGGWWDAIVARFYMAVPWPASP